MYAKLVNGAFRPAPYKLRVGNNIVYNPTDEMLLAAGYKPVEFTDAPETEAGYSAEAGWRDNGDTIVQTWTIIELPLDEEIPDDEAFSIIIGAQ